MLSLLIRQKLFGLLHWVLSCTAAIKYVYFLLRVKKCGFSRNNELNSRVRAVLNSVPHMKKLPKHLVLQADPDHHSLSDLAQVVIWSLVAGIPYVSFYDITGYLKENEEKLFLEVERNKKGIPGFIKWSNMPDLNGYTNGIANRIVINIFNNSDGRKKLADCIRQIAEDSILCKISSDQRLTANQLDKIISLSYPSIPDPDLMLYTGSLCCTHGLLPWQIRLTEFIKLSEYSHHVNIDNYLGALYKYNKCDQRFGK